MNLYFESDSELIIVNIIKFKYLKKTTSNFLFAKTVGIYLIPIIITVIFYSHTAILGESILVIDTLSFVIAVIVGQLVSYRLLTGKTLLYNLDVVSLVALILLVLAFVLFTCYPPQLPLFQGPLTGVWNCRSLTVLSVEVKVCDLLYLRFFKLNWKKVLV